MITSNKSLRRITTRSFIPEEIISDILLRVSPDDLARFKSVSKRWLSLISNPNFIEAFIARAQQEIIFTSSEKFIGRIKTHFECNHFSVNLRNNMKAKNLLFPVKQGVKPKELRLVSTCDGLLVFKNIYDPNQIFISNPVTAHCVALPPAKYFRVHWALVHDACINKYKVYGITTQRKYISLTQGEIDWVEADIPTTTLRGQLKVLTQLIVANKELHWLSIDIDHEALGVAAYQTFRLGVAANRRYRLGVAANQRYSLPVSYYIFSIHIETGDFRKTKVPPCLANPDIVLRFKGRKDRHHILSKVKGSLCLTIVSHDQLQMFVLEDRFSGEWIKTQNICLQSLLIGKPSTFLESFLSNEASIVPSRDFITSSNSLQIMTILVHHEDGLFLYDLKSQQWQKIAFLSKGAKLSKISEFHYNSLTCWD